jgi:hypothetical protein
MDHRRQKLRLALWILALGTLLAVAWHGWQGWGLGRTYPYNTYIYVQESHFTDFTGVVDFSKLSCPYEHEFAFYFPATYLMFQPFVWLGDRPSLWLYLLATLIGTILMQRYVLRTVVPEPVPRLLAALVLMACSYAFVISFDRANVELAMALLVGGALLLCRRVRFGWAVFLISITILLKLYPILLLALFIRRRHFRYLAWPGIICLALSILSLMTFSRPIGTSLALWGQNLKEYNFLYMVADRGLSGSGSPWNLVKIVFLTADHLHLIDLHLHPMVNGDHYSTFFIPLSKIYNGVFLGLLAALVLFVTFVEREFFRRAVLLLLFVSICAQAGADYKLLWVHVALLVLIVLPTWRRFDWWAVGLMALALVPKKEILLTYLGQTDTTYNDVSIGVVLNPLLIFAAGVLLLHDSWRARVPGWAGRRFFATFHQLMDLTPWRGRWKRSGPGGHPAIAGSSQD